MSKEQWYKLIEEWEKAELRPSDFCRQNQLQKHQFYYWRLSRKKALQPKGIDAGNKNIKQLFSPVDLSNFPIKQTQSTTHAIEIFLLYGIVLKLPLPEC